MDLYSSTLINYHLDAIQGLMMAMMDNNNRMLRILHNIENKFSASSKIPEASAHRDEIVSLDHKCEPDDISSAEVDASLDNGRSSHADDPKVLVETVETKIDYAYKMFAEIPNTKSDMIVEDSVTNDSVKHEIQVPDEMFQPVSAVKNAYSHLIIFDDPLALQRLLTASSHDQPMGWDIFNYLTKRYRAKSLRRFPPDQFGLEFPFDPGSRFLTTYLGGTSKCICRDMLGSLTSDMLMASILWNRLMRISGTLLTGSVAFFIKFAATVSAYIFQAIFNGSVRMGIEQLGQQLSAMEVHQYPANGLCDAMYSVSTICCSVKEADAKGRLFSVSSGHLQLSEVLLLCHIGLFVDLPKNASEIAENARLGMARNLRRLLCIFLDEDMSVYIMLELPKTSRNSPKLNELLSYFSKTTLKTFLMVSSMSHSWCAIDSFLVKPLVYSYFIFPFELQNRQLLAQYHISNAKLPITVILDNSELLVEHNVFESLWEGNYILIKDGIRLMHQIKFLHSRPAGESSKAYFVEFITLLVALLYGFIQAFVKVLPVNR